MIRDKKRLNQVFYVFLNICLAFALTMQFERPKYNLYSGDLAWLKDIVMNLRQSLKNTSFYSSVLLGLFLVVNTKINEKKKDRLVMMPYIAFLVAMVWLLGKSFAIDNTLYSIHSTAGQWIKSLIFVCGITYFINQFGYLVFWVFSGNSVWSKGFSKISEVWNNHTFLFSFFTLLICWLPHILINYPGSMCRDAWNQIAAFFGVINFTSHHPPAHTWLISSFVKLGQILGNSGGGGICNSTFTKYNICSHFSLCFYHYEEIEDTKMAYCHDLVDSSNFTNLYYIYRNHIERCNLFLYVFTIYDRASLYHFRWRKILEEHTPYRTVSNIYDFGNSF